MAVSLIFLLAIFGIGSLAQRKAELGINLISEIMCIGLCIYIFIIGCLNFLSLGSEPLMWILLGFSSALGMIEVCRRRVEVRKLAEGLPLLTLLVVVIVALKIALIGVPNALNYHDDVHKYVIFPFKFLTTGTMYGSPVTAIGSETLGAQQAGQIPFALTGDFRNLNLFDQACCYILFNLYAVEISKRLKRALVNTYWAPPVIACCSDLMVVNISSNYSSAFVGIGAIILLHRYAISNISILPFSKAFAITCTTALLLKPTMIVLVAPLILGASLIGLKKISFSKFISGALTFLAVSSTFSLPWLINPLKRLLDQGQPTDHLELVYNWSLEPALLNLSALFVPGQSAPYGFPPSIIFLSLALIIFLALRENLFPISENRIKFQALFLGLSATVIMLLWPISDFGTNVRYLLPQATAIMVAIQLYTLRIPFENYDGEQVDLSTGRQGTEKLSKDAHRGELEGGVLALTSFGVFLVFLMNTFISAKCGNDLRFRELSCSPGYAEYFEKIQSKRFNEEIAKLQKNVPSGMKIVSYIDTPLSLDFKRNIILETDAAALGKGLSAFSPSYYYFLQLNGYATRTQSQARSALESQGPYYLKAWAYGQEALYQKINLWLSSGEQEVLYKDESFIITAPSGKR